MKGELSVEYPFIIFLVGFFATLTFFYSLGMPIFQIASIGNLPTTPEHWYQYPGYFLSTMGYFFKLLITPAVPIELRFMSALLFAPISIVLAWLIIKWIAPIIASMIPLT